MRRVVIESPFAGNTTEEIERNLRYLRAAMRDCLMRGEAPFASHGLFTQEGVLRDEITAERRLGMRAGFAWGEVAEAVVVYQDLGITTGMTTGINRAVAAGQPIEFRRLPGEALQ